MKKEIYLHAAIITLIFGSLILALLSTRQLTILWVILAVVVFGVIAWILGLLVTPKLHKVYFQIQRFSWLHLVFGQKWIPNQDYFISKTTRDPIGSLFLLWIGSWALIVSIASGIVESTGLTLLNTSNLEESFSAGFDSMFLAWFITPLVSFIVIPISVIESSNLRIFLKNKGVILSPTTPFRYAIGGFFTLNILSQILRGLDVVEIFISIVALSTPFYVMALLHRLCSEKILVENFKKYLKTKGIVEKDVDIT